MDDRINESLRKSIKIAFFIFTPLTVLIYFLSLPIGLILLLLTNEGLKLSSSVLDSIPVSFFIFINFLVPVKVSVGTFFIFLLIIYTICFAMAWRLRIGFHSIIVDGISKPIKKGLNNFLFAMPLISSTLMLTIVTIQSLQESIGIETGSISFPNQFEGLFQLTYSPILEEISYRITPLGFILLVYIFIQLGKKGNLPSLTTCALCFIYPDKAKKNANVDTAHDKGLVRGISSAEWIALLLTSSIFGLNHYFPGGGWDIGKISSATLAGIVFGLAYLYYGIHAPILLHWSFNYYMYTYGLFAETYPGLFEYLPILVIFSMTILGAFGWLTLLTSFFNKFSTRVFKFITLSSSHASKLLLARAEEIE